MATFQEIQDLSRRINDLSQAIPRLDNLDLTRTESYFSIIAGDGCDNLTLQIDEDLVRSIINAVLPVLLDAYDQASAKLVFALKEDVPEGS